MPMFSTRQKATQAAAMQEIEVISMDDGEDNVTTTSLSSPPSMVSLSAADSPTSRAASPLPIWSSQEEAMSTLLAMISNETTLPAIDHHARSKVKATPISISASSSAPATPGGMAPMDESNDPVNDHDRTKMCDWYFEMSDFLKIERSTASRSLTLLDRFMAAPIGNKRKIGTVSKSCCPSSSSSLSPEAAVEPYDVAGVIVAASQNRDEYQLVALTALFLAIKLFERLNIQPEHVSYLSRGRYTSHEVVGMEMVMLAALEWRVCVADKVDYVNAYLDVCFPGKMLSTKRSLTCEEAKKIEESVSKYDRVLSSLKDLANLQIQLSDFESSFSTQRQSLVAFAAVLNAFEMKKNELSQVDQHVFLESVQKLTNRLYSSRKDREEVAGTVERLRALLDPPSTSSNAPVANINLTPTSHQKYLHHSVVTPTREDGSRSARSADISPLDVALESMENFDMAQLLCCGSHQHRAPSSSYNNGHNHNMVGNPTVPLESVSSFSSIDNSGKVGCHNAIMANSNSPTSIATILFGAGKQ